ncbi:MAG TPA: MBL fold metallo-hydrolase [Solirubrobacteraceae bacterium]|nr:MBL fold metallo-hydrolase [Solirubrobacteraceae bacterium]
MTADSEPSTFEAAAAAGIHCLPIPTPFLVGRVNCYLIDDEPLTLVDTGPNSGKSLDELEQALAAHGRSVEELELIVLTHQHMDHVGLLEILSRRSGAEVAALAPLAPYLADWGASAAADDEFAQQTMRRHGTPAELATVLGAVGAAFRAFGSGGPVTRRLSEGDELAFRDRTLRVLHRPGHSPSDTLFWDERRRMVLGGDHLLAHISSNPLVTRPLDQAADDGGARPHALITYLESMEKTRSLELDLVLPGHGEAITDHVSLIDERFRMHERRARKLLRLLEPAPLSAYELALQMWGNIAVTQAFLTISEVLGHLDLLVRDGDVAELERDGVVRFEALG